MSSAEDEEPFGPFTMDSIRRLLAFLPTFERGEFAEALDVYKRTGRDLPNVDALRSELCKGGFPVLFGGTESAGAERTQFGPVVQAPSAFGERFRRSCVLGADGVTG